VTPRQSGAFRQEKRSTSLAWTPSGGENCQPVPEVWFISVFFLFHFFGTLFALSWRAIIIWPGRIFCIESYLWIPTRCMCRCFSTYWCLYVCMFILTYCIVCTLFAGLFTWLISIIVLIFMLLSLSAFVRFFIKETACLLGSVVLPIVGDSWVASVRVSIATQLNSTRRYKRAFSRCKVTWSQKQSVFGPL